MQLTSGDTCRVWRHRGVLGIRISWDLGCPALVERFLHLLALLLREIELRRRGELRK